MRELSSRSWSDLFDANSMGHANNIPTMQFFTGISKNTQSKSYMLPLTECVRDFRNIALWDTIQLMRRLISFITLLIVHLRDNAQLVRVPYGKPVLTSPPICKLHYASGIRSYMLNVMMSGKQN